MERASRKKIGRLGEDVAVQYLARKGFTIIERNYWKPWGEIDIIAVKNNTVRFVEVKAVSREKLPDFSRENAGYRPEEQVHPFKLEKLSRTADLYMTSKNDNRDYQIDVVAVFLNPATRQARCFLYEQVL